MLERSTYNCPSTPSHVLPRYQIEEGGEGVPNFIIYIKNLIQYGPHYSSSTHIHYLAIVGDTWCYMTNYVEYSEKTWQTDVNATSNQIRTVLHHYDISVNYYLESHNALNVNYIFHCSSTKVNWAIMHIVEHKWLYLVKLTFSIRNYSSM